MQAPLTALLLCNDPQSLAVIDRTFAAFSVSTYFCMSGESAQLSVNQRKFDLLMLDLDEPGVAGLVEFRATDLWGCPGVLIAMGTNPAVMQHVLRKRVHFALQKPFTRQAMTEALEAGYRFILNERRTTFRHIVRAPAQASYLVRHERHIIENASVQDLSAIGLCLQSDTLVPKDAPVFIDFSLPELDSTLHLIAKVMWSDAHGRAGVQFRFMPPADHQQLRDWLNQRCPWDSELAARTPGNSDDAALAVPARVR